MSYVNAYHRMPVRFVKGEGAFVETDQGERFLDMYGAHAVSVLGHAHPEWVRAMSEQMAKLPFYSNVVHLEHQDEAANLLAELLPEGLNHCFFVNSGAEAVENALRVARLKTGKSKLLAFDGGFHGRTLGAQLVTGLARYRAGSEWANSEHLFAPFGDIAAVSQLARQHRVAAIIVEPIQSLAGVREADNDFFVKLRALCDETSTVLIFDELQTAVGRSGAFSYAEKIGVTPDLMTLGKGLGAGFPVAALAMSNAINQVVTPGVLGTTFGGGPLASLAVKKTLEIMKRDRLAENARILGERIKHALRESVLVEEVRGSGLLLGIKLRKPASEIQKQLLAHQVFVGTSDDPFVLRIMPPLTVTDRDIDLFLEAFARVS